MSNPYGIDIKRNKTRQIFVGDVPVGGDSPISVQSMTNTDTRDIKSTVDQVIGLQDAGADLVRISCPDVESSHALKKIIDETNVPIVPVNSSISRNISIGIFIESSKYSK